MLKRSERLFKMFLFLPFRIKSFSSKHNLHFLEPAGICFIIPHLITKVRLSLFNCQIYFESLVSFWYFMLFRDFRWLRYRVLKSLAVTPMYDFVILLSVVVTSALYTTLVCRRLPWIGNCSRCLQLQLRVAIVLVLLVWLENSHKLCRGFQ